VEHKTALHLAVYERKVEGVKVLLKCGAAVDAKTLHFRTPLHIACIIGEDVICAQLLSAGASVNEQDYEQNTPVHYASYYSTVDF
jgi:hypothetical protein